MHLWSRDIVVRAHNDVAHARSLAGGPAAEPVHAPPVSGQCHDVVRATQAARGYTAAASRAHARTLNQPRCTNARPATRTALAAAPSCACTSVSVLGCACSCLAACANSCCEKTSVCRGLARPHTQAHKPARVRNKHLLCMQNKNTPHANRWYLHRAHRAEQHPRTTRMQVLGYGAHRPRRGGALLPATSMHDTL
jgi:hypothetical protein